MSPECWLKSQSNDIFTSVTSHDQLGLFSLVAATLEALVCHRKGWTMTTLIDLWIGKSTGTRKWKLKRGSEYVVLSFTHELLIHGIIEESRKCYFMLFWEMYDFSWGVLHSVCTTVNTDNCLNCRNRSQSFAQSSVSTSELELGVLAPPSVKCEQRSRVTVTKWCVWWSSSWLKCISAVWHETSQKQEVMVNKLSCSDLLSHCSSSTQWSLKLVWLVLLISCQWVGNAAKPHIIIK